MLRPSNNLLGSSRSAHRANLRAERLRALWQIPRAVTSVVSSLVTAVVDLVLLCGLPLAYLASAYLVLDLPARFIGHRHALPLVARLRLGEQERREKDDHGVAPCGLELTCTNKTSITWVAA